MSYKNKRYYKHIAVLIATVMVLATGVSVHATTENRPYVYSPQTIGGATAMGHSEYSSNIAYGETVHGIISTKKVTVIGIYRDGSEIKSKLAVSGTSSTVNKASATSVLSPTSSSRYFIGVHAMHRVTYLTITWEDYTAVGQQVY